MVFENIMCIELFYVTPVDAGPGFLYYFLIVSLQPTSSCYLTRWPLSSRHAKKQTTCPANGRFSKEEKCLAIELSGQECE